MENLYNKKQYNPIVETMNNNYLSQFSNSANPNQNAVAENGDNKDLPQNETQNQNPLINLLSNPSLLSGGNYGDILKNFAGNKNEMLMSLINTMNKSKTTPNNKSTTVDFSNLKSIDDYDFLD